MSSNVIGNTIRHTMNENPPEFRTAIGGSFGGTITITPQIRTAITQTWTCVVDGPGFPASYISGLTPNPGSVNGPFLQPQRTTALPNKWYLYEETWLSYGNWTNLTTSTST